MCESWILKVVLQRRVSCSCCGAMLILCGEIVEAEVVDRRCWRGAGVDEMIIHMAANTVGRQQQLAILVQARWPKDGMVGSHCAALLCAGVQVESRRPVTDPRSLSIAGGTVGVNCKLGIMCRGVLMQVVPPQRPMLVWYKAR